MDAVHASFVQLNSSVARGSGDPAFAKKALVSLAGKLLDGKKFKEAVSCLSDLKKGGGLEPDEVAAVDRMLSEASFRTAYDLAAQGQADKASTINATLVKLPEEMGFQSRAQYQKAILQHNLSACSLLESRR